MVLLAYEEPLQSVYFDPAGAAAGSDLWSGVGVTLGPIDESAPEAAACAGSERGDLGGVTLGIESIRGGPLELVGWLDLRLIT